MTNYRVVVRHARYWRGQPHRWSTVWPFTGSLSAGNYGAFITAMRALDGGLCYSGGSTNAGTIYEIALYDQATGGVPIAVTDYATWSTPSTWIAYASTGWPSTSTAASNEAETALQAEWGAGLSKSGKPVTFKKWFHCVPQTAAGLGSADIPAATVTSLQNFATTALNTAQSYGPLLGNSSRLAAATPVVRPFFGNHQMPRGRRKKQTSSQAQSLGSEVFQLVMGGNKNVSSD